MSGPIASAVVLPELEEVSPPPASPSNTLKRRQSSVTKDSVKRARTSDDKVVDESKPDAPKRRERGRERRLFGAVLGALSQNPTTPGQKRRSEIEKRQQAQRKQEDEEGEQRKAERLARRKAQRWKEQKHFERGAMRVRHDNLLHLAHFLCTKTEPRLYYKPWEMSQEEQDWIDEQIAEAQEIIQRERDEYEDRQEEERRREPQAAVDEHLDRGTTASLNSQTHNANSAQSYYRNNGATNGGGSYTQDHEMKDEREDIINRAIEPNRTEEPAMDTRPLEPEANAEEPSKDADEEVVEAAEDTVIY